MDIFRVQDLYAGVPEFVGEEEGDEKTPHDPIFVVRSSTSLLFSSYRVTCICVHRVSPAFPFTCMFELAAAFIAEHQLTVQVGASLRGEASKW